jgi:hypothetical protein
MLIDEANSSFGNAATAHHLISNPRGVCEQWSLQWNATSSVQLCHWHKLTAPQGGQSFSFTLPYALSGFTFLPLSHSGVIHVHHRKTWILAHLAGTNSRISGMHSVRGNPGQKREKTSGLFPDLSLGISSTSEKNR